MLAVIAAAAAALLIIPDQDSDPAAEAYALQALAHQNADGEAEEVAEPQTASTFEVANRSLETNELENFSGALELARLKRLATTTVAPSTTEPGTTQAPTTKAPASTTAAPETTKPAPETSAAAADSSNEEQSAAPADDATAGDATTGDETNETTEAGDTNQPTETTEQAPPTTEEETTTAPPTTAPPTTAPPTTAAGNGFVDAGHGVFVPPILLEIRRCESGGNYQAANPSSSARGAYQFLTGSWAAYGHADRYGVSRAHLASNAQQDEAALITWQRDGTRPWNASRHCWG